ncbi:MAG: type II toxin-antitoxin system VapC family toxin [Bacteroidia bacterium]|nr:type II toxin-antitoxin system VapC family toxin [Bacteroidia bacterium]
MSGNRYLLDTNIVIAALNDQLVFPAAEYYVSVITEIELLSFHSLSKADELQIKCFLRDVHIVELTTKIKEQTIALRRDKRLKLPDAIICASAIINEAKLVTEDVRLHNGVVEKVITLNNFLRGV